MLGIYLAEHAHTAEHVAASFVGSNDFDIEQRWIALGGEPASGQLGEVTAMSVRQPTPKYPLLNRLLAEEDLANYDFVVTTDDDIVLPEGFPDLFLGVQAGVGFDLAQPARTPNSYVDHPIVIRQRGVVARRTRFVEIGPLVSFGREIYDLVFPFDETNPMGWGFENVWAHQLRERGSSQGIVDAVPIDHSIRKPVAQLRVVRRQCRSGSILGEQAPPSLAGVRPGPRGRGGGPMSNSEPGGVFFVHMQKTAGTALRQGLINHFGKRAVYPTQGMDGTDPTQLVTSTDYLRERLAARGDEIEAITGHFPLCTTELLDGRYTTLTLLREPVERSLSYLRHHRKEEPADRDRSLEEIYEDPFRFQGFVHNHMTKMLSLTPAEMTDGMLTPLELNEIHLERAKGGARTASMRWGSRSDSTSSSAG